MKYVLFYFYYYTTNNKSKETRIVGGRIHWQDQFDTDPTELLSYVFPVLSNLSRICNRKHGALPI